MSKTQKIIGAVLAAVTITLGTLSLLWPENSHGQAAVGYPQPVSGYTQQPVLLTNVQIASLFVSSMVLSPQTATNFPTGLTVGDSNALITASNPYGAMWSGAGAVRSNYLFISGAVSNGAVFGVFYNPNTNLLTISNLLVKIKTESFQ